MPASLRSAIALALTVAALPGVMSLDVEPSVALLTLSVLDGVAVAIPAALGIWIATMAGDLFDELGGAFGRFTTNLLGIERSATGTLFGFVAILVFLTQGGTSKLATAMTLPLGATNFGFERLLQAVSTGIGLSVTLAAPLVVAQLVLQLGGLLATKVSSSEALRVLVLPIQGLLRLILLAVFFEWVLFAIASRH